VTCYTQPCNAYKVNALSPEGDESSPRGRWSICAPALPGVLTERWDYKLGAPGRSQGKQPC
jgi:hypothetical protein